MAALRRVFGDKAGPEALGILVPPGPRTVVVVRPRALAWDLLLIERGTDIIRFRAFAREEAEAAAEAFARALDNWSAGGPGRIDTAPAPGCPGHCVRAEVGTLCLIACPRLTGESYRPMVWATPEEAQQAADALRAVLCPAPGARQEVYFNTRNFTRP
jgi:hypothetical protein